MFGYRIQWSFANMKKIDMSIRKRMHCSAKTLHHFSNTEEGQKEMNCIGLLLRLKIKVYKAVLFFFFWTIHHYFNIIWIGNWFNSITLNWIQGILVTQTGKEEWSSMRVALRLRQRRNVLLSQLPTSTIPFPIHNYIASTILFSPQRYTIWLWSYLSKAIVHCKCSQFKSLIGKAGPFSLKLFPPKYDFGPQFESLKVSVWKYFSGVLFTLHKQWLPKTNKQATTTTKLAKNKTK